MADEGDVVQMPNGDWVRFPKGWTKAQIRHAIGQKFPKEMAGLSTGAEDLVRGAGKGLARVGVGAVNLGAKAAGVEPPQVAKDLGKWANSPSKSWSETAGRVGGETLPFMFQPELGLWRAGVAAAPYIGRAGPLLGTLAERAAVGGSAAGIPAASDPSADSGGATAAGAAGAAALGGLGAAAPALARFNTLWGEHALASLVMRHMGIPFEEILPSLIAWHAIRTSALGRAAGRGAGAATSVLGRAAGATPPALLGGLVGEGVRSKDQ